ncbi:exo-alpha-sialidase [Marinilongibacter aquaticus]|uniref:sialidase family protein n=1 Tax=Marinilongibacter aquaticus TaxID=2975157 RepID=UPI0021BD4C07|nr:sialidase family protein [Marinilongibacter aquaticus]UBM58924.1 exo-alpha-sialidase [Marinilongibacter aquaticus]
MMKLRLLGQIALAVGLILHTHVQLFAQDTVPKPPGIVVNYIPQSTGKYIGSPSICILKDGSYLASHDEFGPKSSEFRSAQTHIFKSSDQGNTWEEVAKIDGQFWSTLFEHKGDVYIIGTNKHHGNFVIRKSIDGGKTWTIPYSDKTGLLLPGEYHTAPVPVVFYKGRIWRALEYATAPTTSWGKRYSAMVISAPENADLLDASNWQKTNHLPYDSSYLDGKFNAWLEGNFVVGRKGELLDILRVDVPAGTKEQAAWVQISPDGKRASFDAQSGFVEMPGASKKFTIRYDKKSKRYWSLVNLVEDKYTASVPARIRNQQALVSSADLKNWDIHEVLVSNPDTEKHGFQYVDWIFDGDHILWLCRTAFDDSHGGANNFHDANFLTFHRIEDFRKYLKN